MKNNNFFKVETVEHFKILKYININFRDNSLDLEIVDDKAIIATDKNGNEIIFYYDYNAQKVKSRESI